MLKFILDISLKNRLVVLLGAVALLMIGVYVTSTMKIDVFPDLTAPTVTVITDAHGLEAEEVEKQVTKWVETGLNGSPNVRRLRSSSQKGISTVWVEFEWGTEIYKARQIVSEKIPQILEDLPYGIGKPTMAPISSIMGEIMIVGVNADPNYKGEPMSPMDMRTIADWEIMPRLKAVEGVANIVTVGGEYKQYQVQALPLKMDYYGVTLNELTEAVKACNASSSGGILNQYGNQYVIKGEGKVHKVSDIASGFIKMKSSDHVGGADIPILIGDVAKVEIGYKDKVGDGSMNAGAAVLLTVIKQPDANTLEVTEELNKAIENLRPSLPEGLQVDNTVFRQADFIEASVSNLQKTLLEGALFVILVLFIFLMNWRTTVISLIAIPLSLLVSFIVLKMMGYTINTMSLGGMAIAIGALVDDAIIDVENVYKRLRENVKLPKSEQLSSLKVVFNASVEIRSSILIATLIIIVAFIPLFFLGGMEGRLLQPLGISFITSVVTSLFVAVTITPVLCSYLLKREKLLLKQSNGTRAERFLSKSYKAVLKKFLKVPKLTIGVAILAFVISLFCLSGLGRSFLPPFNEGALVLLVTGPPSMSLEESNKTGNAIEQIVLSLPEVDVVTRRTGRGELDEHGQGVNAAELEVPFTIKNRSKEEFLKALRKKLKAVSGVSVIVGMPMGHRIDHMISGTRANIAIKIFGPDLAKLFSLSNAAKSEIIDIDGIADVSVEQQIEVPKIEIVPNKTLLALNGLTVKAYNNFIDVAFAGEVVDKVPEENGTFDLVVRYDSSSRGTIDQIRNALINNGLGQMIPLKDIAEINSISTPHTINKEKVQCKVVVSANISGRDLKGVVTDIQNRLAANLDMPPGYRIEYGGQFENEQKASRMLLITSIFAILIIFLLLYLEFKKIKLALIVLLNLPLALIGGIFIVYFTTGIVSIASTIGFISLFGIATRNGILLVSRYQALEKEEPDMDKRIIHGSIDRLNPILMTALTTALALVPLAINGSEPGNEIQSPMAIVILGGLLTATFLNILVIPCVYKLTVRSRA
ncbi:MAG: CzcA family heavy metal efflux pump [Parvicellaceae bacterium]|jgi:CzcA family heavy metal efflux pump